MKIRLISTLLIIMLAAFFITGCAVDKEETIVDDVVNAVADEVKTEITQEIDSIKAEIDPQNIKDEINQEISGVKQEIEEVKQELNPENIKKDIQNEILEEIAPVENEPEQTPAPDPTPKHDPAPNNQNANITQAEAEAIALAHAGLSAADVTRIRSEYESDDRPPHYDVEFRQDVWEYEYEIHAETGDVLSFDKEHDD